LIAPSGQQGQIKSVEVRSVVTDLQLSTQPPLEPGKEYQPIAQQFDFGPAVDVISYVQADGRAIRMTVIPRTLEFLGYILDAPAEILAEVWDHSGLPAKPDSRRAAPASGRQEFPLPMFRERRMVSSATVWDGQTLVLATRVAKIRPPDGHPALQLSPERLERLISKSKASRELGKTLFVFVTARQVDPAGNALYSDEELPVRAKSIPPQAPSGK